MFLQKQANSGLNRDNLIVKFDPFISDEDVWVQNSYKKEDIIPMLEKVHQGFGRILVELTSELGLNFPLQSQYWLSFIIYDV